MIVIDKIYLNKLIHAYNDQLKYFITYKDLDSSDIIDKNIKRIKTLLNFLSNEHITLNNKSKIYNYYISDDEELAELGLEIMNESLKNES